MQYVKYISKYSVEIAPKNKGSILNFNTNTELMIENGYLPLIQAVKPTDRLYTITYKKNENSIEEELIVETDEQKASRIRQELDQKTLTPADTWRAVYKARGLTKEDVLEKIEKEVPGIDMEAVKIEFGASLYYRGAKFGDNRIFDTIGAMLGYTSDNIDYLFQYKEFPVDTETVEETEE